MGWKEAANKAISLYNRTLAPRASTLYGALRHPTYMQVYHGSPTPFNIREAWMGTYNDAGLHVGNNRKIAQGFARYYDKQAGNHSPGYVYKFMIPRAKVFTPDLHSNGINLLSDNYIWAKAPESGDWANEFDINTDDPIIMGKIKELGYLDKLFDKSSYEQDQFKSLPLITGDKSIVISPRQIISQGVPKNQRESFNFAADQLYRQYMDAFNAAQTKPLYCYKYGPLSVDETTSFNLKTANLLSKYGIKTLGYYNNNPYEQVEKCWMILDPSVIYQPPTFELPYIKKYGGILKRIESGKSGIYIKPENKGKFTETKKGTGKTTEELTHSKNPLTRKRAIFAQNAKKWNHKK